MEVDATIVPLQQEKLALLCLDLHITQEIKPKEMLWLFHDNKRK